ncbi:TIGR01458 family HAD-type hydrolase [Methylothermus subterraneus]
MTGLKRIRGLLLDLEGVLYVGSQVIPGAEEALDALRRRCVCRFITNTSTLSLASLHAKLNALGLAIPKQEIFSAPQAVLNYLKRQGDPVCHLLLAEDVKRDFASLRQSDTYADYVVAGDIGEGWNYAVLNRAFRLLFSGAELIAVHKNRFWQTEEGLKMDLGGFVAALEYASAKQARIIGKPAPEFFRLALADMQLAPEQVAVVGDDIDTDISGGQAVGLLTILVKTGKYRESYVRASPIRPDWVIASIRELPKALGIA